MLKRLISQVTNRIHELPVLVLMPHSRCNCRCVMCDIWKANDQKKEISVEDLRPHFSSFKKLGVKRVALSGGEALMHSNLWKFCQHLNSIDVKISLLSTGLSLKQHAREVVQYVDDVIVSIDGSSQVHDSIRNIPNAFTKLEAGVKELKLVDPEFRVTGRCVLQKNNFHDFLNIIEAAKSLGLDQISFLPADISSEAFNRPTGWLPEKVSEIALTSKEVEEFEEVTEQSFSVYRQEYKSRFIAENPQKIKDMVNYYRSLDGVKPFPSKKCNAPWVSAVVESDGEVKPCFFHPSYGNIYADNFENILNSDEAITFRKNLDVKKNSICEKCVCSLHVGIAQSNF